MLARRIDEAEAHVWEAIRLQPTVWAHRFALTEMVFRRSRLREWWMEQSRRVLRQPQAKVWTSF
jgi:hypothetical protein